jgi:L-asparagine transporter-like permease
MKRAFTSLLVGAVAGLLVASAVGTALNITKPAGIDDLISNAFSFWGIFDGTFAALVAAGMTFALLNRHEPRKSRWGRWLAAITLGIFAAGLIWLIVGLGVPPLTPEGEWMYPLAALLIVAAVLVLRRRRPNFWDEPPG